MRIFKFKRIIRRNFTLLYLSILLGFLGGLMLLTSVNSKSNYLSFSQLNLPNNIKIHLPSVRQGLYIAGQDY